MPRLLRLRESRKAARAFHERIARVAALAVACLVGGFLAATYWDRAHLIPPHDSGSLSARSSVIPIERTLDLTNYLTTRGAGRRAREAAAGIARRHAAREYHLSAIQ